MAHFRATALTSYTHVGRDGNPFEKSLGQYLIKRKHSEPVICEFDKGMVHAISEATVTDT